MFNQAKIWKKIFFLLFCFFFPPLTASPTAIWNDLDLPDRAYSAMSYDTSSGQMILFGGLSIASSLNDTWTLSFDSTTQTYTWNAVTPSNSPPARHDFSMVFDEISGRMILFGGLDNNGDFLNDTWALSFDSTTQTYNWEDITPATITPTNNPPARIGASMAFDTKRGKIILFGRRN